MALRVKPKNRSENKRQAIEPVTAVKLWVRAGGRCEFGGCNEYLLRDNLTLREANYSNIAHIVAASPSGPRGSDPLPAKKLREFDNLILLCKKHHTLIDNREHEHDYTVDLLKEFKRRHEDRIYRLTATQPDHKTVVVRLISNIVGESVSIPIERIQEAIAPRYSAEKEIEIDLTGFAADRGATSWLTARNAITEKMKSLYAAGIEKEPVSHISVFALAPIPLLVHLGSCLSNKIQVELYQRHRDSEDWVWKRRGRIAKYRIRKVKGGTQKSKVALLLSLSGTIKLADLPEEVRKRFNIYEISLKNEAPNPLFLQRRESLVGFVAAYHRLLRAIRSAHKNLREIHLFPAVPAPVAVACGRERLRKVDPALMVYDYNKRDGSKGKLRVN